MRKYFEFYNGTKINCGESALSTIGKELIYWGVRRPILLSSPNADKLGITEKVKAAISPDAAEEIVCFGNVPQKVEPDVAREIKAVFEEKQCDAIIAVGGDSVMDVAKCVKLFLSQECDEILPIASDVTRKGREVPMIAIPSENGSGKEANGIFETEESFVSSSALVPNVVIIDEDTIMAAPTRVLAASGAYALANAIEAYLQAQEEDPAEIYAEKAMRLLARNLVKAVNDSENAEACRATALASTLAGIAYGNSPFGAAHALAEGLSEVTGEPVEEMFAITLVPAMKKAREIYDDRVKKIYYEIAGETAYAETPDSERAARAISAVADLFEDLMKVSNIPTRLSMTSVQREMFGGIADAAANRRAAVMTIGTADKACFLQLLNDAY